MNTLHCRARRCTSSLDEGVGKTTLDSRPVDFGTLAVRKGYVDMERDAVPGELGNSAGSSCRVEVEVEAEGRVWIARQVKVWAQSARIAEASVHCSDVDMVEEDIAQVVVGHVGLSGSVVWIPAQMLAAKSSIFLVQAEDTGCFVVRTAVLRPAENSQLLPSGVSIYQKWYRRRCLADEEIGPVMKWRGLGRLITENEATCPETEPGTRAHKAWPMC